MPSNKDFKRLVRARMARTGESYTAARAVLIRKTAAVGAAVGPALLRGAATSAAPPLAHYAALAGMRDAALKRKTGCTWEKWVETLDHVKAHDWPHRAIAQYVRERYEIGSWWAQTVTVGYERIRGLRERGQRRDGRYQASKSRTLAVPLGTLFRAFAQPRQRARWLPGVALTIRKATHNKSVRITWEDGTPVEGTFSSKGRSRSQVAVQHSSLASREAADRAKQFWGQRLDALERLLAPDDG